MSTKTEVVTSGSCKFFSSFPMQCMLCQAHVPANTPHSCSFEKREVSQPKPKKITTRKMGAK